MRLLQSTTSGGSFLVCFLFFFVFFWGGEGRGRGNSPTSTCSVTRRQISDETLSPTSAGVGRAKQNKMKPKKKGKGLARRRYGLDSAARLQKPLGAHWPDPMSPDCASPRSSSTAAVALLFVCFFTASSRSSLSYGTFSGTFYKNNCNPSFFSARVIAAGTRLLNGKNFNSIAVSKMLFPKTEIVALSAIRLNQQGAISFGKC